VMQDLHGWLRGHAPTVLPKSPLGEAFGYALSNWASLNTFVEHGILEADNNLSERALKPVALSRKNWLFAGSERGEARRMFPHQRNHRFQLLDQVRHEEFCPHTGAELRQDVADQFSAMGDKETENTGGSSASRV